MLVFTDGDTLTDGEGAKVEEITTTGALVDITVGALVNGAFVVAIVGDVVAAIVGPLVDEVTVVSLAKTQSSERKQNLS